MAFAKIAHAVGLSVASRALTALVGCSGRLAYAFSSVIGFASRAIESAHANSLVNRLSRPEERCRQRLFQPE
jgi:hypothetical protein